MMKWLINLWTYDYTNSWHTATVNKLFLREQTSGRVRFKQMLHNKYLPSQLLHDLAKSVLTQDSFPVLCFLRAVFSMTSSITY